MTPTEGGKRKEEVALAGFSSFTTVAVVVVVVLYFPALRVMYAHTMPLSVRVCVRTFRVEEGGT